MSNPSSEARCYVIRLETGDDLKNRLREFAVTNHIEAAIIVTCVGSLTQCNLRFANQEMGSVQNGHFEIVSLVGTLSQSAMHLHLSISDERGSTIGGHLLDGNIVYTTAEIAICGVAGAKLPTGHGPCHRLSGAPHYKHAETLRGHIHEIVYGLFCVR